MMQLLATSEVLASSMSSVLGVDFRTASKFERARALRRLVAKELQAMEPEKFLKQPENREKLHVILGQLAKAAISFQPTEYQVKLLKYHPEITKALKSLTLEQWHAALQDRPEGYPLDESLFAGITRFANDREERLGRLSYTGE